jgi:hypothetical protein
MWYNWKKIKKYFRLLKQRRTEKCTFHTKKLGRFQCAKILLNGLAFKVSEV